jgi:hypothetical protein
MPPQALGGLHETLEVAAAAPPSPAIPPEWSPSSRIPWSLPGEPDAFRRGSAYTQRGPGSFPFGSLFGKWRRRPCSPPPQLSPAPRLT